MLSPEPLQPYPLLASKVLASTLHVLLLRLSLDLPSYLRCWELPPSQFASSRVLEGIQHGLFDSHCLYGCELKLTTKQMEQLAGKILSCGHHISECVQLVEIAEFKLGHHNTLNEAVEVGEIANHSGFRIGLAAYGDLYFVIVSMAMRVVAFAIKLQVSFGAELGRVQPMRSRKLIPSCEMGLHASPYTSTKRSSVS